MKRFTVAGLAFSLMAAAPAPNDYQTVLDTLHITFVRAGADGKNPAAANAANDDETRTGAYSLPDPLRLANGTVVTTADS